MVNDNLSKLVKAWRLSGRPPQESFDWSKSRANWIKDLPNQLDFIKSLPGSLSRIDVRLICDSAEVDVTNKFLTSMIWGYGDVGYGSYRVRKMFASEGFSEKIETSYLLTVSGGVKEAYQYLSRNRVQQLGPAFGTKWLSFASPRDCAAPIYDSFISLWVSNFAKIDFSQVSTSSEVWNSKTYFRYLDWMVENSSALDIQPDDLELLIFQDATLKFANQSKWSGL